MDDPDLLPPKDLPPNTSTTDATDPNPPAQPPDVPDGEAPMEVAVTTIIPPPPETDAPLDPSIPEPEQSSLPPAGPDGSLETSETAATNDTPTAEKDHAEGTAEFGDAIESGPVAVETLPSEASAETIAVEGSIEPGEATMAASLDTHEKPPIENTSEDAIATDPSALVKADNNQPSSDISDQPATDPSQLPPPATPEDGIPPTPSTAPGTADTGDVTSASLDDESGVRGLEVVGGEADVGRPVSIQSVDEFTTPETVADASGEVASVEVVRAEEEQRDGTAGSSLDVVESAQSGSSTMADGLYVANVGTDVVADEVGEAAGADIHAEAREPATVELTVESEPPTGVPAVAEPTTAPSPEAPSLVSSTTITPAPPVRPPAELHSRLEEWYKKRYLGGYRGRQSGVEYFHAETQTPTPMEIKAMTAPPKFHRDTQTKFIRNRIAQSKKETATQMPTPRLHVSTETDVYVYPHPYTTADQYEASLIRDIIRIQCWVRRVFAGRLVRKMRAEREERARLMVEKERRRKELADRKRRKEVESRLHPKSQQDFEILYNGLENWRQQETAKINAAGYSEPARLAALADLLDQEAALIQKIDRLRIAANEENRDRRIVKLLDVMSSPKRWPVHTTQPHHAHAVHVDTPSTIRARELKDLYHALNVPLLSVDERLQILLHVKYTVKEFDCNLTREIVELIDREGDLVSRGREAKSLEGLRRRISNLFMQFIQTPEFNPEAALYQKYPQTTTSQTAHVYYCRSCTRYLPSTQFYLSTTLKHLGKCKDCTAKENIATQRKDDSSYADMLKLMRLQEARRRLQQQQSQQSQSSSSPKASKEDLSPYTAISLLQESDLRYLIDQIWSRQSAISASKDLTALILTRWNPAEELSPWNCILLTKQEAATHDAQVDAREMYSAEFRGRVEQRHLVARRHFGQLPAMERYLRRVYGGEGGERRKEGRAAREVMVE